MTTYAIILRNNRTLGRKKLSDKSDDFIFEDGLYFIKREKIIIDKSSIRGKIKPTIFYAEGVAEPIYFDNFKIKEYKEYVHILDDKGKQILDENKKPKLVLKIVKRIEDIFIDARAIHNLTDRKILSVLSAQKDIETKDLIIMILSIIGIVITIGLYFFINSLNIGGSTV